MQLTTKPDIKATLALASCALLGITQPAAAQTTENTWLFDTALLYYGEPDRVTAVEAMINANKTFNDGDILNLRLTLDTLTGASANGAIAQPTIQTFTRPSGNGQYQIGANKTPLDDTFKDTRVQLNGQWTQTISPNYTLSTGGHLSKEYDYLSLGVNSNLAIDLNNKNTTASFGLSYFYDTFSPEGDIPKPFAQMLIGDSESSSWDQAFAQTRRADSDNKTTTDLLFGVTQVINRRMIMQLNYSYSIVDGYLTDPFKILSVVNTQGITQQYRYENRPDKRQKQSIFLQSKYHFDLGILDLSYRYLWDDWQIKSHTVDTRYRFDLADGSYIEPHLRFYQQTAADFYRPYLIEDDPLPNFASADYRIGEMNSFTVGLKYGTTLQNGDKLAFRLEYYKQTPKDGGFSAFGDLAQLDLFEPIDAIIAQVSYSF